MKETQYKLETILSKALQEEKLSKAEVVFLLGLDKSEHINRLFATAKSLRHKHFGTKIFLYGFIYASTYCRNDCRFCFFADQIPKASDTVNRHLILLRLPPNRRSPVSI